MSSSGYSGTPLIKKLGIKPGLHLLLINIPSNYFELLGSDVSDQVAGKHVIPDLVHLFVKNNADFEKEMIKLKPVLKSNPALSIWVSWYKKTAKVATDITEDIIRDYALRNNLVDVKVCAVNELWSGLKLVVPLAKR